MRGTLVSKSKFVSLVLRHNPGLIGLTLDPQGWAPVDELLSKAAAHGTLLTAAELAAIVATNEKQRFDLDAPRNRIRANQGHSIEVDLELAATPPPAQLFHGSAANNRSSILKAGLIRGARQHVHLSVDIATARIVGTRHGSPIVFSVASGDMHRDGHTFLLSKNGVWLTEAVPPKYLREI